MEIFSQHFFSVMVVELVSSILHRSDLIWVKAEDGFYKKITQKKDINNNV